MLLQFTVGNFKSFKEKASLSLEATSDDWLEEENVAVLPGRRLVKAAAIYGANASGKSNFLLAMGHFREFIINSSREMQLGEKIPLVPFRLHLETETAPSFFEAIFLQDNARYRYGFEATVSKVISEWLFVQKASIRETRLFTRDEQGIAISDEFKEGKGLEQRTRPNALFLSVCAQFNGKIAGEIFEWLQHFRGISGLDDQNYMPFTAKRLNENVYAGLIQELTHKADIGIEHLRTQEVSVQEAIKGATMAVPKVLVEKIRQGMIAGELGAFAIKTSHRKFGTDQHPAGSIEFDLKADESAGTQKFVALTGPFVHTLKEGSILVVDELEARLHPLLTKALVGLFNSSANTRNAQLIFATHDEGLLDPQRIRRDQVWFVEKDNFGASNLYSLTEFKVRKEAKFGKEYMLGQFGAVPRLGDFEETFTHGRD